MSRQSALRLNGQSATYRCAKFLDLVEAAAWAAAAKPVTSAKEYRAIASECLTALELLAEHPGIGFSPWVSLAAQTLECTLKAYIAKLGLPAPGRRQQSHDLINLWSSAVNASATATHKLSLDPRPPEWCLMLNAFHDHPFQERHLGAHGMPAGTERTRLARALRKLLTEVEAAFH